MNVPLPPSFNSRSAFKQWILPLGLIVVALLFLNWGLYTRLAPQPIVSVYGLPYFESFDNTPSETWFNLGGDWQTSGDGFLILTDPQDTEAALTMPLELDPKTTYQYTVRFNDSQDLLNGGGIIFNLDYPKLRQRSHMAYFQEQLDGLYLITGYADSLNNFEPQAGVRVTQNLDTLNNPELAVLVEAETYKLALNNQIIVQDVPLEYKGGWLGLTANGPIRIDSIQVDALTSAEDREATTPDVVSEAIAPVEPATQPAQPQTKPTTLDLPDTGEQLFGSVFEGVLANDADWVPFSGDWAFENGSLVQRNVAGYDQNIGHRGYFENYRLRVALRHLQGQGAGLLFNMPAPDSANGAQMVRYDSENNAIFWGYFDNNGVFVGQGYADVNPPGTTPHTFEIVNNGKNVVILLDDIVIAQDIVPFNTNGGVGLTTSASEVAFDSVEVFPLAGTVPGPTASTELLNLETVSGEWVQEGNEIRQLRDEATDFVSGTGVAAEKYTLSVNLTLPDDPELPDVGGGLIFNMPNRDNKQGAQMVRLTDAGKTIIWGSYDENNLFLGQGDAVVDLTPGVPHNITLVVRDNGYDLYLNNQLVEQSLPLKSGGGWIGLLSFRGPISFTDFNLSLSTKQEQ